MDLGKVQFFRFFLLNKVEKVGKVGNFNKLFRFCDRTGDFIILWFKFLTIATAKTVRTFLIPETLDSTPLLPDARRPSYNKVRGFWIDKAGEALGSRGSRDDGKP
jgi:hypothetical protein